MIQRLGFVIAIAVVVLISAAGGRAAAQTTVRRPMVNRPITEVLRELQRRGLPIVFSSEVVRSSMRVTTEPTARDDRKLLTEILAPHGLEVREAARGMLLVLPKPAPEVAAIVPAVAPGLTIAGVVVDGATGVPLSGVFVRLRGPEDERTIVTDGQGRFALGRWPAGTYQLFVSLVGDSLVEDELIVSGSAALDVTVVLAEGARTHTEEVVVVGDRFRGSSTSKPSTLAFSGTDLRELRGVLADDAFRMVQVAPGVTSTNDFRSEFSIRGSDFRQVGLLVEGFAVGWPVHAVREDWSGGSVGLINADTIDQITMVSGVSPPDRPGRTGGWLDLTMREGSRTRTQAHAAVSMTSASLVTEGPLAGGRGSWLVAARQSYLQWVLKRLNASGTRFGFGDGQVKLVYDVTPRHQARVLAMVGRSLLEIDRERPDPNLVTRGDSTLGLVGATWQSVFGSSVVTQRLGYTFTRFTNDGPTMSGLASGSGDEWMYRADAAVPAGRAATVHGGFYVRSRHVDQRFTRLVGFTDGPRTPRVETIAGSESDVLLHARATSRIGPVHVDAGVMSLRARLSPSLSVRVPAGPWTVRAGLGVSRQQPDLEQSASSFATVDLASSRAHHIDLEIERAWGDRTRAVLTWYRRNERNGTRLVGDEFRLVDGRIRLPSLAPEWRNALRTRGSGFEWLVQRRSPTRVSGWIAYTYSTSRVADETTGEHWDADFDQRHTVNAQAHLRWSSVTSFSAKVRFGSNTPLVGYLASSASGERLAAVRNDVRLPAYARVDVRANRAFNKSSRRITVFVEVLNVLARTNRTAACACTNWADGPRVESNGRVTSTTQRLFPFLPSIGVVIDF